MPPTSEDKDHSHAKKRTLRRKVSSSTSADFFDIKKFPSRRPNRPMAPITVTVNRGCKPLPSRDSNGNLLFADFPEFRPNLAPKEILQLGSFGGTHFQPITSGITGEITYYREAWREFPSDWFEGLEINRMVAATTYSAHVNMYKVACRSGLKDWEESGWICHLNPYGWFQWYCRFFMGRRCTDDYRQIARALGVMGSTGRWKKNLLNKCASAVGRIAEKSNGTYGSGVTELERVVQDFTISPKIRQLLQVCTYKLQVV
ncbi:hypothetical protein EON65_45470 [archaeon]|nr:MAG: hypothetical protein EON65_45470 [archaeon]